MRGIGRGEGGWLSSPSSSDVPAGEPVEAAGIRAGDMLMIDGKPVTVDAVDATHYVDDRTGEKVGGLAVWWTAPNSRGVLRRRPGDLLYRAASGRVTGVPGKPFGGQPGAILGLP